ncbi:MAG: hypothetical protein FWE53_03300 [Firmicutes bacterium]|nr:hypothetical protein [Bacillota bacterium]
MAKEFLVEYGLRITKNGRYSPALTKEWRNQPNYKNAALRDKLYLEALQGQRKTNAIGSSLTFTAAFEKFVRKAGLPTALAEITNLTAKTKEHACAYFMDGSWRIADLTQSIKGTAKKGRVVNEAHLALPVSEYEARVKENGNVIKYAPISDILDQKNANKTIADLTSIEAGKLDSRLATTISTKMQELFPPTDRFADYKPITNVMPAKLIRAK